MQDGIRTTRNRCFGRFLWLPVGGAALAGTLSRRGLPPFPNCRMYQPHAWWHALTTDEIYREYLGALLAGDRRAALAALDRAQQLPLELGALYLHVLQPAMREIGRMWQENLVNVAQEHLASAITEQAMLRAFARLRCPEPRSHALLAACVAGERHQIGLRMLCDLMEQQGWDAFLVSCDLPLPGLVRMVRERQPAVVALSTTIPQNVPRLAEAVAAIRAAGGDPRPLVLVGGRAFHERPDLARAIGADLSASDAAEAVQMLRERFA